MSVAFSTPIDKIVPDFVDCPDINRPPVSSYTFSKRVFTYRHYLHSSHLTVCTPSCFKYIAIIHEVVHSNNEACLQRGRTIKLIMPTLSPVLAYFVSFRGRMRATDREAEQPVQCGRRGPYGVHFAE